MRDFRCGFVVGRRLWHLVSGFTPVNKKLTKIRIKAKFHNISMIWAHAESHCPFSEEKDLAVKNAFYANLEDVYDKCLAHENKTVLGDFIEKVGQEGIFGPTVGQFSLHSTTSPNGMRLKEFTAAQNMIVCCTRFQHLEIQQFRVSRSINPKQDWSHCDWRKACLQRARCGLGTLSCRSQGANAHKDGWVIIRSTLRQAPSSTIFFRLHS